MGIIECIEQLNTALDDINTLTKQRDALLAACEDAVKTMENEAVQANGEWETGMFCGLEDRGIVDRYEACRYGYDCALKKIYEWVINLLEQAIADVK